MKGESPSAVEPLLGRQSELDRLTEVRTTVRMSVFESFGFDISLPFSETSKIRLFNPFSPGFDGMRLVGNSIFGGAK